MYLSSKFLVQGKPSSGGDSHSCCSLLRMVSMLALVLMLSVFVDFLRKKKSRGIVIVNVWYFANFNSLCLSSNWLSF